MIDNPILSEKFQILRGQTDQAIKELHDLTHQIQNADLSATVNDLRTRLYEPYMFVIVGEVKAGKSSFINALLKTGRDICAVSPAPMTDTIQQIVYGEQEASIVVNPYLKKVFVNEPILKEIAVVDTPGTNTIVAHHQEITEQFIPVSDLIIFVFEAKNPYRQSAWDFFDFIHSDWRKQIIFVLQQKDLLSADDLVVNVNGLYNMAQRKGIEKPEIFCVSAKNELEGLTDQSGFYGVRQFILNNVTGGKSKFKKIKNNLEAAENILERIKLKLDGRRQQFELDQSFRSDIDQTLDHQESKSNNQVEMLVENLVNVYRKNTGKTRTALEDGLSFGSLIRRSFASIFNQDASSKVWLTKLTADLENSLNEELKLKLNDGVIDLVDSIQQMARMIELKIKSGAYLVKTNEDDIFSTITEKRNNVLRELQESFTKFMSKSESFTDDTIMEGTKSLSPNLATGGGLAIIGVILATLTKATVFDITGGILTTVGFLFAGITVGWQRNKVINAFQEEIDKGQSQLEDILNQKLKTYVKNIKGRINGNFADMDALFANEQILLKSLDENYELIKTSFEGLLRSINQEIINAAQNK